MAAEPVHRPPRSVRFAPWVLRSASLLGIGVSVLLLQQHVRYVNGRTLDSEFCQVGGFFDCLAIESSGYSSLLGVPVASIGLFYFLLLSAFAWFTNPGAESGQQRFWQGMAALLTLPSLLVGWGLAMLSAFVIESFCFGCTITYLAILIGASAPLLMAPSKYLVSMGLAVSDIRKRLSRTPENEGRLAHRALIAGAVGVFAVISFVPGFVLTREATQNPESLGKPDYLADYLARPVVPLSPPRSGLSEGNRDAPLQLVVFTDFACPYCARFEKRLKRVLETRTDRYHLSYKHYPLSKECNPIMKHAAFDHAKACRLAEMAEALGDLGKYPEWGGELYDIGEQDLYPALKEIANRAGVNYGQWAATATQSTVRKRVEADIQEGLALGLKALPAFYVNGRYVENLQEESIEAVLTAVESGMLRGAE